MAAGGAAIAAMAVAGCGGQGNTAVNTPTKPHATDRPASARPTPPKPKPKPKAQPTVLSPGQTVSWTWDDEGTLEHYRITLQSAHDFGKDDYYAKYDVERLMLKVVNTGSNQAEADLLTPMVWIGTNGQVDQTIGGDTASNTSSENGQPGTDLSLNSRLAPGQFEQGYQDVDVLRGPGTIVIPGTDGMGNTVEADSLVINYMNLPKSDFGAS